MQALTISLDLRSAVYDLLMKKATKACYRLSNAEETILANYENVVSEEAELTRDWIT
ncbi:hypothetical protein [Paenibacillus cymbidii]|uniref:hypothetical protein n=1 Tax=Paenibacillus cymbidii TaxID=1639034 RepID=UPI00143685FC|nr:hypothetical protein [Paenibacillus cymbidii]